MTHERNEREPAHGQKRGSVAEQDNGDVLEIAWIVALALPSHTWRHLGGPPSRNVAEILDFA